MSLLMCGRPTMFALVVLLAQMALAKLRGRL